MKNKIVIIAGYSRSISNFRGDLIKSWGKLGYEVCAVGPENDCREDILALGVKEVFNITINRTGTNIISDLKYIIRLRKSLKRINPDNITLGYTIKPAIYGVIAAKTIFPHHRELVECVFKCPIRDQYASLEGAPFISECSHGKLHYRMDSGIIELVNSDESLVGDIAVTSFTTYAPPCEVPYR